VADHDYDTTIATAEITLRPIDIDVWRTSGAKVTNSAGLVPTYPIRAPAHNHHRACNTSCERTACRVAIVRGST
jgi:hypothetical protein